MLHTRSITGPNFVLAPFTRSDHVTHVDEQQLPHQNKPSDIPKTPPDTPGKFLVIAFRKKCAGIAYSSIGEILATDVGKMDLARIHETEILSHIVAIIVNIAIVIIAIVTIAIVTIAIVNIPIVIIAIVTIATVIIPIVIIAIVVKATAAAAVGKMELARTHGTEIPEGWALDKWDFFQSDKDKQVGFLQSEKDKDTWRMYRITILMIIIILTIIIILYHHHVNADQGW